MDREIIKKFEIGEEKEDRLWEDAIIVFDTSALIDFYYYPNTTRNEIFEKIFTPFAKRFWIPFQVQFEYLKNRKNIIRKPITERYEPLKKEKIKELKNANATIKRVSEQIKKDTKKPEKHPYLPQDKIDAFIEFTKEIDEKINQFEGDLISDIVKQETEIESLNQNDTILEAFEAFFTVGEELPFERILEIVAEGKFRYEFKIPPGYMDEKEKIGTQKFGDLIVWKQILDFSKAQNKSILFICNDVKIDWCYTDSRNRIKSPREELIKEFYDNSGQEFWMYNQSQFLFKAKEYLQIELEDSKIEEVSRIIDERNKDELIFKCGYCRYTNKVQIKNLFFEYECITSTERNMGMEYEYQLTKQIGCMKCGNDANITYLIWEYPVGAHNNDQISIDEGEIIQSPDFVGQFWKQVHEDDFDDTFD